MNLSIIIISYNTKKLLIDCLQSIEESEKSKNRKLGMEVIIVDNHSTDGTRECLKEIKDNQFKNFTIKTIFNQENVGWAKANNQGIRESRGEYLLFLNPDTKLFPKTIGHLIKAVKNKKDAGIVAPKLLNKSGSKSLFSCFKKQTIMNAFKEYVLNKKNAFQKYVPRGGFPSTVDNVVDTVMLIPKSVINIVGLFDEKYILYYEDLDYCRRVRKAGLTIYYIPQAKAISLKEGGVKDKQKLIKEGKIFYGFLKYYFIKVLGVLNDFKTKKLSFSKIMIIIILTALFTCLLFWWILPNVF